MSMRYLYLLFLIFCCPLLACANTEPPQPLTLSELIDIALKNNPETKQAWWNANRAAAYVGIAESAYYPQLSARGTANNGRTFKFVNGPDTSYTIIGADLILSMMLYDFGRTSADVTSAKMGLLASDWQTNWTMQKVIVEVMENTYSTLHAQESVKAATTSRNDANNLLYVIKELHHAGLRPISDVYTSQATLAQMQMNVILQEASLEIQKGKLAASLGLSADTPLTLAPLSELPTPAETDLQSLIALAKQQRADLMAKQARLLESIANTERARSGFYPKIGLSGYGGANHAFNDRTQAAQYEIALNIDIPLFSGFETVYQNRRAFAEAQMSAEELAQLELKIALEVLTHSRTLQAAQAMMPHAEENLQSSINAYDGIVERYRAGKDGISEVSNALNQLASARLRYSDVTTRYYVALANLAYSTGTLLQYSEEDICE